MALRLNRQLLGPPPVRGNIDDHASFAIFSRTLVRLRRVLPQRPLPRLFPQVLQRHCLRPISLPGQLRSAASRSNSGPQALQHLHQCEPAPTQSQNETLGPVERNGQLLHGYLNCTSAVAWNSKRTIIFGSLKQLIPAAQLLLHHRQSLTDKKRSTRGTSKKCIIQPNGYPSSGRPHGAGGIGMTHGGDDNIHLGTALGKGPSFHRNNIAALGY